MPYILVLLFLCLGSPSAWAHPHVFIDYQISLQHQDKQLKGFQLSWRVDKTNTQLILDAFDKNRNGKLEPQEAQQVAEHMRKSMAEFDFFTEIQLNQQRIAIREVGTIEAKLLQDHLIYRLFIPCSIPLKKQVQTLSFKAIDPSNYVAFMPMQKPFHVPYKGQLSYSIEQLPKALEEPLVLKLQLRP